MAHQTSDAAPQFLVRLSVLEIYNEQVFDLLVDSVGPLQSTGASPSIFFDRETSTTRVRGAREVVAANASSLLRHLEQVLDRKRERERSTAMNVRSSRAHTIFTFLIERSDQTAKGRQFRVGKLILCDLAGSERLTDASSPSALVANEKSMYTNPADRQREMEKRRESAKINTSLLAFTRCMRELCVEVERRRDQAQLVVESDAQSNRLLPKKRNNHIPFRASKLTMLLRDSFVGRTRGRIAIINTIRLEQPLAGATLSTLRFVDRLLNLSNSLAELDRLRGKAQALGKSLGDDDLFSGGIRVGFLG